MSATVVESKVQGLALGDRFCILGASAVTCGGCVYCRRGEFMFCPERRGMGQGVNGAFRSIGRDAAWPAFPARMLKILEQGKIRLGDLITHKLPLDEWKEGFAACEDKSALKVLLHP